MVKVLSLLAPYGDFIMDKLKVYETRSWSASYRGELLIHHSQTYKHEQYEFWLKSLAQTYGSQYPALRRYAQHGYRPALGAIIGLVRLNKIYRVEDCRDHLKPLERELGGYSDKRFAWELEVIRKFQTPIPASGKLGLWDWEGDLGHER